MISRRHTGVVASLVTCVLFACSNHYGDDHESDDDNFRPDVIECEDALDRLKDCCPGFDASAVLCNFHFESTQGCTSSSLDSTKPALDQSESRCIREASCEVLRDSGVCKRAQDAREYTVSASHDAVIFGDASDTSTSHTHEPVCP